MISEAHLNGKYFEPTITTSNISLVLVSECKEVVYVWCTEVTAVWTWAHFQPQRTRKCSWNGAFGPFRTQVVRKLLAAPSTGYKVELVGCDWCNHTGDLQIFKKSSIDKIKFLLPGGVTGSQVLCFTQRLTSVCGVCNTMFFIRRWNLLN